MKKLVCLLLALATTLAFAPCLAEKDNFTIGYLAWDLGLSWNIATYSGLKYGADKAGCKIIELDCKQDAAVQVDQAQQLINQEVDIIVMFPTTAGETIIKMCNDAGIPIIAENSFYDESAGETAGQVACQYNDIGYAAVKWAAENIENAKLVYVSGYYGIGVTEIYEDGVNQALADFADKVTLAAQLTDDDWTIEGAYNVMSSYINGGYDFNIVFAQDDVVAKGAYQALKEAGLDIGVISTGGSEDSHIAMENGEMIANMTAPADLQGLIAFGMAWAELNGETWGGDKIALPVIPIDMANFDEWLFWDDLDGGYQWVVANIGPYVPAI
ncbi:MAG: sugar ABC transporter substrate-binding protein [Clostridiales bacterium]|nr:sugar ABC transporter substrate-binding protein [Clostridiales bacterium]